MKIPITNPTSPVMALKSPPPRRITILKGQPKKARAPITTTIPKRNLVAGEDPAFGFHSFWMKESAKAPNTIPMISGRRYCTLAAWCKPIAPAKSRKKQAIQNPMLAGFPILVRINAARPVAKPASRILASVNLLFMFFSFDVNVCCENASLSGD